MIYCPDPDGDWVLSKRMGTMCLIENTPASLTIPTGEVSDAAKIGDTIALNDNYCKNCDEGWMMFDEKNREFYCPYCA